MTVPCRAAMQSVSKSRLVFVLIAVLSVGPAAAQTPAPGTAAAPAQPEADPLGRSTPWGTVTGFLRASERRDFARAAEYLETRTRGVQAEELARQLLVVMDRGLTVDLDRLSRSPGGSLQDGLPTSQDRIGVIQTNYGQLEVLVKRIERPGQEPIWLFASDTLALVPDAAGELEAFTPEAYLPRYWVEITFLSVPLYRWVFALLLLALAWGLGAALSRVLAPPLRRLFGRLTGDRGDLVTASLDAPMRLLFVGVAIRVFSTISVSLNARQFWTRVAVAIVIIGAAWTLIRLSSIVSERAARRLVQRQLFGRIAVVGLAGRLFRAFVVVIAALALLYRAGVDLTAILTGLGIGGLGVALAAQATVENLFGGIMIISDEPVRVGDFCGIGNLLGTVEDIGVRSTRIRTLSRTVVTVPNGQLAKMNVENYSRRDKFWLRQVVGVRYETSADQLRHLLASVRSMLHAHPKVERDGARIRFVGFGSSSLDLEIFAYVYAIDMSAFLEIQEDILLQVMDLVIESGTSVAFPSQTTYFAKDQPLDAARRKAAEHEVQLWRERGELPFPDFHTRNVDRPRESVADPSPVSSDAGAHHGASR